MRTHEKMLGVFEQCKAALDDMNIEWRNVENLIVKRLAANVYGYTDLITANGITRYEITIYNLFMDERVSENAVKGILFHELLHTVDGCENHDGKWNVLAKMVEAKFPGCPILEHGNNAGIPFEVFRDNFYKGKAKYLLRCNKCGEMFFYRKLTNGILHHKDMTCNCGGKFENVEIIGDISPEDTQNLKEHKVNIKRNR